MMVKEKVISTCLLICTILISACAQDWKLMTEVNALEKISPDTELKTFFEPRGDSELFIKQSHEGSAFAFITNEKWPKLKNFNFTFQFRFEVPEGAKCRETPMFKLISHAEGDTFRTFYRGYHYANLEEKVGRYKKTLMNSKIMATERDVWYAVRYACKGKVLKGKFWVVSEGEPERWTIEGEAFEEPKAGQIGLAYRAWKDQLGTEIIIKGFEIKPIDDEAFEYLDTATRPERTTDSEIGRKLVGFPWEYYAAPDCKWTKKDYARTENWEGQLSHISVPEGWDKPAIKDGKLVLNIPAREGIDKDSVIWFSKIHGITVMTEFEVHCSEGITPLIWYQNRDTKKSTETAWVGPMGVFDPFARNGLATVYTLDHQRISAYGTNHLHLGRNDYKFIFRFRNGCALWYGTTDEVCDILEPRLPDVPWNGQPRIGFSGKGKAGTLTISPISYSK